MPVARLLIVDDHPVVLTGLKIFFEEHRRYAVSGEARSASEARVQVEQLQPDVIITDLTMGQGDGVGLIEDLHTMLPGARIIVYSSRDEAIWAPHAIRAGARAYLAKSEPLDTLIIALDTVMAGAIHVSKAVQQFLGADIARQLDRRTDISELSSRERQIFQLIGAGETLQSLANELGLSVKTVGTYRERLKIKLGLDTVRMLDRYAADHVAGRLGSR